MNAWRAAILIGIIGIAGLIATPRLIGGPIDPPPGPIAPTGVTLQQISDQISALGGQTPGGLFLGVDGGPWEFVAQPSNGNVPLSPQPPLEYVSGSGILHAVNVDHGDQIEVFAETGRRFVGSFSADIAPPGTVTRSPQRVLLNVRYTNGIQVRGASSSSQRGSTHFYAADPGGVAANSPARSNRTNTGHRNTSQIARYHSASGATSP